MRTFTEKLHVEVMLPEGATDIQLFTPKELNTVWNGRRDSWLDFSGGRPLVGFEIQDFFVPEKQVLQYKFQVKF